MCPARTPPVKAHTNEQKRTIKDRQNIQDDQRMQKTREYHKECLPEGGRWKGQVGFKHGLCDACGKEGQVAIAVVGLDVGLFKAEVLEPELEIVAVEAELTDNTGEGVLEVVEAELPNYHSEAEPISSTVRDLDEPEVKEQLEESPEETAPAEVVEPIAEEAVVETPIEKAKVDNTAEIEALKEEAAEVITTGIVTDEKKAQIEALRAQLAELE